MISRNLARFAALALLGIAVSSPGQTPAAKPSLAGPVAPPPAEWTRAPLDSGQLADYVRAQFGPTFKPTPVLERGAAGFVLKNAAPVVMLTGDFDGDGVEDAIIVAKCDVPLGDELKYGYRVIDPYDAYFGFGDPHLTSKFNTADKEDERMLLIVHSWRAEKPKAKFVVINLPFDKLEIGQGVYKKKPRTTIVVTESGIMKSTIAWDGKKYRYVPGTGEAE